MSDESQNQTKNRFWKFTIVLLVIFVLAFLALAARFAPDMWRMWQQNQLTKQLLQQMEEQKRLEAEDTYGGKTPEETYQLLIQALEKQDIDLAVKYFSFDKQGEIRQRLTRIRDNGKWQFMFDDLSGKTSKIEYEKVTESWYEIKIRGSSGDLIAFFITKKYDNKNLWKLTRFD